jgi:aminopeptidase YwaD
MLRRLAFVFAALAFPPVTQAQQPPLLPEAVVAALADETSGEAAHRLVEAIAVHHRTRGSRPFRAAAEAIAEQARAAGLQEVRFEEFPADGRIFYGTQRSRPPWDAEFAELWEVREQGGARVRSVRLASWEAQPMTLAQDSESGEVTAELVDVGNGTSEVDYAGKDVRGKLVLAAAQPGPVARLAVARHGAAGIVSYAQNQRTAWWGQDETLIRWGHLETFAPTRTFGFMVSPGTARVLRERLARGERIVLDASVRAGQRPGNYDVLTAAIPGADPRLAAEEIVFTCHLDHPRPGANDNASGCAAILEAGRTLAKLIAERRIPPPARTLRFVWPPEIEGTLAILAARPEWAERVRAVVHMDMVGGGQETRAIFRVTRGPASLPHFVYDVGEAFGEWVNEQSERFASTGAAAYPLVAPEGGREPLRAMLGEFSMGSDHEVYTEGSWRIPTIYLHDWPDRYIHTTGDTPAMIDPTKLKRAAFLGAASGYFLATMAARDVGEVQRVVELGAVRRAGRTLERLGTLPAAEAANLRRFHHAYEREVAASIDRFAPRAAEQRRRSEQFLASLEGLLGRPAAAPAPTGDGRLVFRRNPDLRGPMTAFGYAYLPDHLGEERTAALRLLGYVGVRGSGGEYAYEVLNLVDGRRTAQQIRDDVAATYGPVPLDLVVEYLRALEEIEVVRPAR